MIKVLRVELLQNYSLPTPNSQLRTPNVLFIPAINEVEGLSVFFGKADLFNILCLVKKDGGRNTEFGPETVF